jgi:hypothetical protein
MITQRSFPVKNLSLWGLLIGFGLIAAYVIFVALVSVWFGLRNVNEDGFWVPVLAGAASIIVVAWVSISILRYLLSRLREKERIRL